MRAVAMSFISLTAGLLLLHDPAAADPCSSGSGKKCRCDAPLTRVCGPKDDPYHKTCWCENRQGGGGGSSGWGSYGKAEIHKKNVPQTHPVPSATAYQRGAFGLRQIRTPAPGALRRW